MLRRIRPRRRRHETARRHGPAGLLSWPRRKFPCTAPGGLDAISIDGVADELTWGRWMASGRLRTSAARRLPARAPWSPGTTTTCTCCSSASTTTPWGTLTQRDAALWTEEVVEVFLDPDGDGRNYAELEINPAQRCGGPADSGSGNRFGRGEAGVGYRGSSDGGSRATRRGLDRGDRHPLGLAGKNGRDGRAEAGRPLARGLYRIERPDGPEDPDTNRQYLAWSRTERHFHEPERFGVIEFALAP
jgi:hypothetical protein